MKSWLICYQTAAMVILLAAGFAEAGIYRLVPEKSDVLPGETIKVLAEAETELGDNLVSFGHFSFAIDLELTGTAKAMGKDVGNILINETFFDDVQSNQMGHPIDNLYIDTAGVTTDVTAPNFGSNVGDVLRLFTFDLTIPQAARFGETIVITPSEGFLENLTVNDNFDPVFPQNFTTARLTVVPEPATATFCVFLISFAVLFRRRRRRAC